jgi:hypothetical protein
MKWGVWCLAICVVAGIAMRAQAGQSSSHKTEQASQGEAPQETERPTLGPRSGPGIDAGPSTATTTDVRKLLRIRTVYVESIDNSLSDKLVEELGKWGRFRLVTKPKDADAMIRGSCLESRHLKHVHSEVYISDHAGKSIWQDTVYRPFNPPTLDQAVDDTARIVAAHLQQTVQRAERQ